MYKNYKCSIDNKYEGLFDLLLDTISTQENYLNLKGSNGATCEEIKESKNNLEELKKELINKIKSL